MRAGAAADRLDTVNEVKDFITCGFGRDTVLADPEDVVGESCEAVTRRPDIP